MLQDFRVLQAIFPASIYFNEQLLGAREVLVHGIHSRSHFTILTDNRGIRSIHLQGQGSANKYQQEHEKDSNDQLVPFRHETAKGTGNAMSYRGQKRQKSGHLLLLLEGKKRKNRRNKRQGEENGDHDAEGGKYTELTFRNEKGTYEREKARSGR